VLAGVELSFSDGILLSETTLVPYSGVLMLAGAQVTFSDGRLISAE
jgi:hypothetical protein